MPSYRYLHYDVFTDRALEGNQLAVFPDPRGLSAEDMQRVTREMNFSECTFICPAETAGTHVRMRIFTPGEELPMAGHPTVGSTFALAKEGVITPGQREFVFGLGVGPTPVSLDWKGTEVDFVWMTQKTPAHLGTIADRSAFAESIGLSAGDLGDAPPEVVSSGNPFLITPLRSRDAVDRVEINRAPYVACCAAAGLKELPLFIFTTAGATGAEDVYARMLGPGLGVSEDPATGSASGPLGCYLVRHKAVPADKADSMLSLQGAKMGRPSHVHISIGTRRGEITSVRVGGEAVLAGEGTLYVN